MPPVRCPAGRDHQRPRLPAPSRDVHGARHALSRAWPRSRRRRSRDRAGAVAAHARRSPPRRLRTRASPPRPARDLGALGDRPRRNPSPASSGSRSGSRTSSSSERSSPRKGHASVVAGARRDRARAIPMFAWSSPDRRDGRATRILAELDRPWVDVLGSVDRDGSRGALPARHPGRLPLALRRLRIAGPGGARTGTAGPRLGHPPASRGRRRSRGAGGSRTIRMTSPMRSIISSLTSRCGRACRRMANGAPPGSASPR